MGGKLGESNSMVGRGEKKHQWSTQVSNCPKGGGGAAQKKCGRVEGNLPELSGRTPNDPLRGAFWVKSKKKKNLQNGQGDPDDIKGSPRPKGGGRHQTR